VPLEWRRRVRCEGVEVSDEGRQQICGDGADVDKFVDKVKRKEAGIRLMGFGHPVLSTRTRGPRS
jgi:citrate synthase